MIRPLIFAAALLGAVVLAAGAADNAKTNKPTRPAKERKATLKELREKYDKDKDGKLSKEERSTFSAEDKAKLKEFRAAHKKAKGK